MCAARRLISEHNNRKLNVAQSQAAVSGAAEFILKTHAALSRSDAGRVAIEHHLPELMENTVDVNRWSRISEAAQDVHPNHAATFVGHLLQVTAAKDRATFERTLNLAKERTHGPANPNTGRTILAWLRGMVPVKRGK